jgi:hypothetical protein
MNCGMSLEELRALPVSVDLPTAGRAFGIGRTKAHELARRGEFPCQVLRVGTKYRVPRAAIFEALGLNPADYGRARHAADPPGDAA